MSFLQYLANQDVINSDIIEIIKNRVNDDWYNLLLEMTDLSEGFIAQSQSEYYNLEYVSLKDKIILQNTNQENFQVLPAFPYNEFGKLYVALYDPSDLNIKDKINYYLGYKNVEYVIATRSDIQNKFISTDNDLIQSIILSALKNNASDIHITPFSKILVIMFRIDGELVEYKTLSMDEYSALAIALKVRAKLDISENRRPQSGQFCLKQLFLKRIDFRLSTHPTIYGENIVIRVLNKDKQLISIESLGFFEEDIKYLKRISKLNQGIIIFCGPTGSGKTTSIYALIEQMDKKTRNIMTLEDPVEYEISNVRQTEINVIDFATGIRSLLRQDPDVILLGEIRDEETAQMAIRASMTGHLVLTTIHSNDSINAIFRLAQFGVSKQFIAENIVAIISQRLVRFVNKPGRTVIYEILKPDDKFKNLLSCNATRQELTEFATNVLHFQTIKDNAMLKVKSGTISATDIAEKYNF